MRGITLESQRKERNGCSCFRHMTVAKYVKESVVSAAINL